MYYLRELTEHQQTIVKIKAGNTRLNLNFRTHHNTFNSQFDTLYELTRQGKADHKLELRLLICVTTFALNTLDTGFTLSRNVVTYSKYNKDNPESSKVSWKRMNRLLSDLEDQGYVENYSGFKDKTNDEKMNSCVLFTDKLIDMFPDSKLKQYAGVSKQKSVVVRDNAPPKEGSNWDDEVVKVEIANVRGIGAARVIVDEINNWSDTHEFKFCGIEKKVRLQRVHFQTLLDAGRFYFGSLQTIKSDKRQLFTIDGEEVTERDIVSNHPFLIAEHEQADLPEDFLPYDIDVSDIIQHKDDPKRVRSLIKMTIMFLLNSGTPSASLKRAWKANSELITVSMESDKKTPFHKIEGNPFYGLSGMKNSKELVKRVEEHNYYAKDWFGNKGGRWSELQAMDSNIILLVMQELMKRNYGFLVYHDSVLVGKSKGDELEEIIKDSWKKVMGSNRYCKIDTKF